MHTPPGFAAEVLPHGSRSMDRCSIPDHQHLPQLPHQLSQKRHAPLTVDRLLVAHRQQPSVLRHSPDDRQVLPAMRVLQNRRLSHRRPRADSRRQQIDPRLIGEDYRVPFRFCGFFTAGHRCSVHSATAFGLPWRARRRGFCTLKPSRCRIRPTWSVW